MKVNILHHEGENVEIGENDKGKNSVVHSCKDFKKGNNGKWIWKTKTSDSDGRKAIGRECEQRESWRQGQG